MLGNSKISSLRARILDFSGVLGATAPKGLELALIKFAGLGACPTKASINLEFLREFTRKSRIPRQDLEFLLKNH